MNIWIWVSIAIIIIFVLFLYLLNKLKDEQVEGFGGSMIETFKNCCKRLMGKN